MNLEIIDTTDWNEEKKEEFYFSQLMPISVSKHKRLRGKVRSHKAGAISYGSVLFTGDNFFTGEKALEKLKQLKEGKVG